MPQHITLVSHALCPYVQRIAIALAEKGVAHDRLTVDLANKPQWFLDISPNGQVPVLITDDGRALFESDAIVEYLEEVYPPLQPDLPPAAASSRATSTP